jgi:hypothetical protein
MAQSVAVGGNVAANAPDSVKTPLAACLRCGRELPARPRGRGGKFCSGRCRSAAFQAGRVTLLNELHEIIKRAGVIMRTLEGDDSNDESGERNSFSNRCG